MNLDAIGTASIQMHLGETLQAVSISVLKKAMQADENAAAALITQIGEANPAPAFGHLLNLHI